MLLPVVRYLALRVVDHVIATKVVDVQLEVFGRRGLDLAGGSALLDAGNAGGGADRDAEGLGQAGRPHAIRQLIEGDHIPPTANGPNAVVRRILDVARFHASVAYYVRGRQPEARETVLHAPVESTIPARAS